MSSLQSFAARIRAEIPACKGYNEDEIIRSLWNKFSYDRLLRNQKKFVDGLGLDINEYIDGDLISECVSEQCLVLAYNIFFDELHLRNGVVHICSASYLYNRYIFSDTVVVSVESVYLALIACIISCDITFDDCALYGSLSIDGSHVLGSVVLNNTRIADFLANNINVVGALITNSSEINELNLIKSSIAGGIITNDTDIGFANFINAYIKMPISAQSTRFSQPPDFSGATIHEGTIWDHKHNWPPTPPKNLASLYRARYERLKLEMARLNKHEDEMFFFAKELECRRVELGWFRGLPIALYGLLSGYGQSYARPVNGLLVTIAAGTIAWVSHFGEGKFWKSLGFSMTHTFSIFSFLRELLDPEDLKHLSSLLTVVVGAQPVLGVLFLFLLGLALRNHFRMK